MNVSNKHNDDFWDFSERLASKGYIVSVVLGPSGGRLKGRVTYSVMVRNWKGEEFDKPFAATNLGMIVLIVKNEIEERGWPSVD